MNDEYLLDYNKLDVELMHQLQQSWARTEEVARDNDMAQRVWERECARYRAEVQAA